MQDLLLHCIHHLHRCSSHLAPRLLAHPVQQQLARCSLGASSSLAACGSCAADCGQTAGQCWGGRLVKQGQRILELVVVTCQGVTGAQAGQDLCGIARVCVLEGAQAAPASGNSGTKAAAMSRSHTGSVSLESQNQQYYVPCRSVMMVMTVA